MMKAKQTISNKILSALLAIVVAIGFTVTMPMTANAEDGLDMAGATQLSLGTPYWGTAITSDGVDYNETFTFTTSSNNSFYNIFLTNSTYDDDLTLTIYDSDGAQIDYVDYVDIHQKKYYSDKLQPNKKYYLRIYDSGYSSIKGDYKLEVNEVKDEAGDDSVNASSRALNKKHSGKIDTSEDVDWYKFKATKSGKYTFTLWNPSNNTMYVNRYDSDVVYVEDYSYIWSKESRTATFNLKKNEICYIKVYSYVSGTDSAKYQFKLAAPAVAKPSKVAISSVKAGKKSLTVKFKKAKNATKYRVAVKVKTAKKWKYYTSKKLAKKITKLKTGKKYNVKVQGIRVVGKKSYYGKWSKTKTVKVK